MRGVKGRDERGSEEDEGGGEHLHISEGKTCSSDSCKALFNFQIVIPVIQPVIPIPDLRVLFSRSDKSNLSHSELHIVPSSHKVSSFCTTCVLHFENIRQFEAKKKKKESKYLLSSN